MADGYTSPQTAPAATRSGGCLPKAARRFKSRANEADQDEESPDGRFIYYSKGWPLQTSLWRIPAEGGEEVKVLDSVHTYGRWTLGQEGAYFFTPPDKQGHGDIRLYVLDGQDQEDPDDRAGNL